MVLIIADSPIPCRAVPVSPKRPAPIVFGLVIRASNRRSITNLFSRDDKFSPLLTNVCDGDRYSHETNPFAREKTDRRSPETNPKSSQPLRELQRACERAKKHAIFQGKTRRATICPDYPRRSRWPYKKLHISVL